MGLIKIEVKGECESRRTVQLGPMAATDLKCTQNNGHKGRHSVSRRFGDVLMTAEWSSD